MIHRGVLPEHGEFSLQCWAKDILDLDVQTVRKMFEEADIRYRRMQSLRFFDAADVRAAFGIVTKETDPDYAKHGGRRVKKPKPEQEE
jgi:hypothetical protein